MKKILISVLLVAMIFTMLASCTPMLTREQEYKLISTGKSHLSPMMTSTSYDTSSLEECVGYADYVFLGRVMMYSKTVNDTPSETPETYYNISIIENIKGNLQQNKAIEIIKIGGLSKNRKSIILSENDYLPLESKYYIFIAYANSIGQLYLNGENSNILFNYSDNYANNLTYLKVLTAYENEKVFQRPRFPSVFQES